MSKEQYVTHRIAKLLKKEKFDWECLARYDKPIFSNNVSIFTEANAIDWNTYYYGSDYRCSAPTQQTVCDWIEKTYGFFIEVSRHIDLNGNYHYFYVILDKENKYASSTTGDNSYSSKSDAVEAALEYCLINLV